MEDSIDNEKKKLISDFNEAKLQILRLHNIWNSCNILSCAGNLQAWKWKLDSAWRELRKDAKDIDGEEEPKDKDSFYQRIKVVNEEIGKVSGKTEDLYNALDKKESLIRELQDVAGKGSKKREQDADLMD